MPQLDTNDEAVKAKLKRLEELRRLDRESHQKVLARARKSFPHFVEYVLQDESTGGSVQLVPLQLKWIEHLHFAWSHGLHAVILAPYGSGKTSIFGIAFPLFLLGQDTSLRILMLSANDRIARERLVLVRNYIDYSDRYHEVFPHVRRNEDQGWTKSELFIQRTTYAKDPSLVACGATSSNIGKRIDVMILDDVNDAKNTIHQPKMRDVIWTNYKGPFISRMEPGGKIIAIMTRWHQHDLVGNILEDDEMRNKYAFLFQRVTEDYQHIECETIVPQHIPGGHVTHRSELDKLFRLYEGGMI